MIRSRRPPTPATALKLPSRPGGLRALPHQRRDLRGGNFGYVRSGNRQAAHYVQGRTRKIGSGKKRAREIAVCRENQLIRIFLQHEILDGKEARNERLFVARASVRGFFVGNSIANRPAANAVLIPHTFRRG